MSIKNYVIYFHIIIIIIIVIIIHAIQNACRKEMPQNHIQWNKPENDSSVVRKLSAQQGSGERNVCGERVEKGESWDSYITQFYVNASLTKNPRNYVVMTKSSSFT